MYSIRKYRKLIQFYIVFFCLFICQQSFAGEIVINQGVQKKVIKSQSITQSDFIYDIQKIDPVLLAEDVEKLRGAFIRHQHKLIQQVENKQLKASDAIITILIPGGLFYAGYRKQELEQAKDALLAVTAEIEELSNDLIALHAQDITHPLRLAQLP